jgi:Asp-tRNA(Asn)/Glu-tRNA(Gln) amidotransferase A subunit family amidase
MPIGVQLVGRRGGDGALLSIAAWVAEVLRD